MARNSAAGAPKGRGGSGTFSRSNRKSEGTAYMLVVASNDDLARFSDNIWYQIDAGIRMHGGEFRVSLEQMRSYIVTAIKARIEHVSRSQSPNFGALGYNYTGFTVKEGWALPNPVHDLLSSLGEVRIGGGETTILPVWDKGADTLLLAREERDFVTLELRSAMTGLGIQFQNDISRDVDGRHAVMVLTYIPSEDEWWHDSPIDQRDAHSSMLLGLTPVTDVVRGAGGADYTLVDTSQVATALSALKLWVPEWTMERQVVARFTNEAARLSA